MPFEVFDKRTARSPTEPLVSIQKRGFISLNHAAFEAIGSPKDVELLYDRTKQIVGLRGVAANARHGYPIRPNTKGTSHVVSGMLFTKHYDIDVSVSRRWPAQLRDGILCIDIGKPPLSKGAAE